MEAGDITTAEVGQMLPHGTLRVLDADDENLVIRPTSTNNPDDPLNWSLPRKYLSASIVLFITAFTAATSNSFGAAGTALNDDPYHLSWNEQNTAAGVLFLGIGYGTLLLSSAPWLYGRRSSYLVCIIWSMVGNIWFARIRTVGDAIGSQLFVGASEAVAEATVQLSLFDIFHRQQRGVVLGLYVLATSVGTFLGPLISGYIADSTLAWPWIGWFAAMISAMTFLVTWFGLEETMFEREVVLSGSNPLGRPLRNASPIKDEKVPGSPRHRAGDDVQILTPNSTDHPIQHPGGSYRSRIRPITPSVTLIGTGFTQYFFRIWNNIGVFWFPAVLYAGIQWGFQDAWLTFYLTAEDNTWTSPPYNYDDATDAIMCVPTLIGAVIGCMYGGWGSDVFVRWMARRNGGIAEAEHRLWLMLPPAILCPLGLILFGLGTDRVWPWSVPYVGLGFVGFGWGCAGDLSLAYAMDAYPDAILEGMVGVSVINNTLACVFTFACSEWMDEHSISEVFSTIGVVAFAVMAPGTVGMILFGKRLRAWTTPNYERFLRARYS